MKKVFAVIAVLIIVSIPIFERLLTNPSNSLELMQTLRNSENPESLFMDKKNSMPRLLSTYRKNLIRIW